MISIFLQTLPFFALIGCGYLAARWRFFPAEAAAILSRFVFYFALSAMLLRLGATLPFDAIWRPDFLLAYGLACGVLYGGTFVLARLRGEATALATFEAHLSVTGNAGCLGRPLFVALFGVAAAGPLMASISLDLVVFGGLTVFLIELNRGKRTGVAAIATAASGLVRNPMFVSVVAGLIWSRLGLPWPDVLDQFTATLGAAATPCALFAIGCSLTQQSADERLGTAIWLSVLKLAAHPALVAISMLVIFDIEPFYAAMAIAAASLPAAGNVFILAQNYGVAVQRVSGTILVSTVLSVVSVTLILAILPL